MFKGATSLSKAFAAWVPSSWMTIEPYVRTEYPRVVPDAVVEVRVTSAERTFWEKATILHQQAYCQTPLPPWAGIAEELTRIERMINGE